MKSALECSPTSFVALKAFCRCALAFSEVIVGSIEDEPPISQMLVFESKVYTSIYPSIANTLTYTNERRVRSQKSKLLTARSREEEKQDEEEEEEEEEEDEGEVGKKQGEKEVGRLLRRGAQLLVIRILSQLSFKSSHVHTNTHRYTRTRAINSCVYNIVYNLYPHVDTAYI